MKKELRKCFIIGFIFISVFGTLLHFLYEWNSDNRIVGLFSPVNESIWEHMKLFFFPMLLFTVIMSYFHMLQVYYPALVPALLLGLHAGTWFIPSCFYTYSGILGRSITLIDVLLFYLAVFFGLRVAYNKVKNSGLQKYEIPLKILTMIMVTLFMLFSYHPPRWGMFG
ncbi:MAG: hypothetical protein IJ324_05225 [Lachnospiraceae bacterium]|nr:hypothetical protein [Lachnospiraceae bacterium]